MGCGFFYWQLLPQTIGLSQSHELLDLLITNKKYHGCWYGFDTSGLITHIEAPNTLPPIQLRHHVREVVVFMLFLKAVKVKAAFKDVYRVAKSYGRKPRSCTTRCIKYNCILLLILIRKLFEMLLSVIVLQKVKSRLSKCGIRKHAYN